MHACLNMKGGIISHDRGWEMDLHRHSETECSIVLEGHGVAIWAAGEFPIHPGSVILVPPNMQHRFRSSTPIRFGVLQAGPLPEKLIQLFHRLSPPGELTLLALPGQELAQYETLYRSFLQMMSTSLTDADGCCQAWIEVLLHFLLPYAGKQRPLVSINGAADFLRANLNREIKVSELARQAGLSDSAFRSAFHAAIGMSPKQYQQQCRLSETKWLLRSSDKPLGHIAESIGFSNLHTFSRWFASMEGCTASDWRRTHRDNLL